MIGTRKSVQPPARSSSAPRRSAKTSVRKKVSSSSATAPSPEASPTAIAIKIGTSSVGSRSQEGSSRCTPPGTRAGLPNRRRGRRTSVI